jgi:hypothetical protein
MKLLQRVRQEDGAGMTRINPLAQIGQQLLLGNAVRENHALEHATIVLLSQQFPDTRLAGVSIAAGFFIFGDVPTSVIAPTANEALRRLRGAEPDLAIHERCGTNLAVAGLLTGLAAMSVAKLRKPYNTFNNVVLASTAALVVARPLGLLAQRYVTTHTPNASMRVVGVHPFVWRGGVTHFVRTENPDAARLLG